jgi:hypothetical protein
VARLFTVKRYIFEVYHHVFYQFAVGFMELFSTATFEPFWPLHGHFTATYDYKFSTANNFFKTTTFEESGYDDGHLATLVYTLFSQLLCAHGIN